VKISFAEVAWEDYLYWQETDVKILAKLNSLIKDCTRSPFSGLGKPELLKQNWAGWWSRRISDEHRMIYRIKDGALEIAQCRFHY
jgi:toxin YoeB